MSPFAYISSITKERKGANSSRVLVTLRALVATRATITDPLGFR